MQQPPQPPQPPHRQPRQPRHPQPRQPRQPPQPRHVFGASAAGIVAAEAPIIEKPNPAAPSAGTAAFTARFRLEAGFVCDIKVLHSQKVCADPPRLIVRCTFESCKAGEEFACCNVLLSFIFVNESDVVPKRNRHNHHGSILFLDRVAFVFRCGVAASVRERLSS